MKKLAIKVLQNSLLKNNYYIKNIKGDKFWGGKKTRKIGQYKYFKPIVNKKLLI